MTFWQLSSGERRVLCVAGVGLTGVLIALAAGLAGLAKGYNDGVHYMVPFQRQEADTVARTLESKYGPSRHSQYAEEWILRDFFQDRRDGIFVDVGANHYERDSNTYYLETALGWSGIAVEPQTQFAADWHRFRPRSRFVPLFVSDHSDEAATLYVPTNPGAHGMLASMVKEAAQFQGDSVEAVQVKTITMDDLLQASGVSRIDYLNIDIELAEPLALAGLSIERYRPALVSIEAHPPVRQAILDYFARHQYVLDGRYWQADDENFWFRPLR